MPNTQAPPSAGAQKRRRRRLAEQILAECERQDRNIDLETVMNATNVLAQVVRECRGSHGVVILSPARYEAAHSTLAVILRQSLATEAAGLHAAIVAAFLEPGETDIVMTLTPAGAGPEHQIGISIV